MLKLQNRWLNYYQINILKSIHSKGFIHRDIKPDNFCLGILEPTRVYLIDYGLAKRYIDPLTNNHIPLRDGKSLIGTPRYASINALKGIEQSRKDDLEGLGYVFVYLSRGSLPWQGICADSKLERQSKILQFKESISEEQLCEGLPYEFVTYFKYVKRMDFKDSPDYDYLLQLFSDVKLRCEMNTTEDNAVGSLMDVNYILREEKKVEKKESVYIEKVETKCDISLVITNDEEAIKGKCFYSSDMLKKKGEEDLTIPEEHDSHQVTNIPLMSNYHSSDVNMGKKKLHYSST